MLWLEEATVDASREGDLIALGFVPVGEFHEGKIGEIAVKLGKPDVHAVMLTPNQKIKVKQK